MENDLLICSHCGKSKHSSEFRYIAKLRNSVNRKHQCLECKRKLDREYSKTHRELRTKCSSKWAKDHPNKIAISRENEKKRLKKLKEDSLIYRICPVMGKAFKTARKNNYVSVEGVRRHGIDRSRERSFNKYGTTRIRTCMVCGKEYDKFNVSYHSCCSDECHNKVYSYKGKGELIRCYNIKEEGIDRIKVFDRDKWICQGCGVKVVKTKGDSKHHNSPHLDHIIPISKGGSHTYDNVQLLCRRCNTSKSNRLIGQQVLLFK